MNFLKDFPHQSLFLLIVMDGIKSWSVISGTGRVGYVAAGLWLWFAVLVSFVLSMSNYRACGVEK